MQVSGVHTINQQLPLHLFSLAVLRTVARQAATGNGEKITMASGSSGATEPRKRVSKQGQLSRRGSFPTGGFSLESSHEIQYDCGDLVSSSHDDGTGLSESALARVDSGVGYARGKTSLHVSVGFIMICPLLTQ